MKYLLYLNRTERELWRKDGGAWQRLSGQSEAKGLIWAVTDFAEESIAEIKAPRLFGRDRSSFIARQLSNRHPDTPFRTSITPDQDGGLLGEIVPTRFILLGIDAAERLNTELDEATHPVAGVWPVSMLLALLGQERGMPADLFVVLPGPGTLRIVFLKNRTPVLTRLTLTPNQANAQVEEVIRTLRHLENTQVVPRGQQDYSVLLLADPIEFEQPMAAARLKLVGLPRLNANPPEDWRFPLFDLALRSPAGQVAPLERRIEYLSTRLGKTALILAVAIAVAGLAAIGSNLLRIVDISGESHTVTKATDEVNSKIAGVDAEIGRFGVAPDTVRGAAALDEEEIASVPGLDQHLRLIASALAGDPNLRLTELQWRLLAPGIVPCGTGAPPAELAMRDETVAPQGDQRKVEVSFDLAVPKNYGPRDRAQALRMVSKALSAIEGLMLWQDANKDVASGSLQGGGAAGSSTKLSWCLTLPGTTSKTGNAGVAPL
ncbi:MAG: hypothetical protein IPO38_14735 [Rhodocyclaceae bacterium]|nr:hypothetical protein [Rhodocyclaceae bacterium]MBP6109394.1 hypothetical protein [Rhodocyclaceae bacterium]